MTRTTLRLSVLIGTLLCARAEATPILALDPVGGAISGAAGTTIGWGFTLTNTTDYLVVSSADFTPSTSLGTFADFISAFNFFVVGPAPETPTVTQAFDPLAHTGIGSFSISSLAAPGSTVGGQIVLTYDLFSVSPNDPGFDPDVDTLSNGNVLRVNASVSVSRETVPEPGTMLLIASGAAPLLVRLRRRYQRERGVIR